MTWDMYIDLMKEEERKAGEEIGRKAGEEIGRRTGEATNLISLVRRKLEKGKNQTIIADELEETEEKISMIYSLLMENGDKTDEELAVIMLENGN
jgi:predicted transposase YdaD